jgi:predicted aconitase
MLVTFANSAIGAKVNNSGPLLDLFCNILGKVPLYGLLTKEGRQAQIVVKVDAQKLPDAGLLGVAVAQKSAGNVPYIYGLEKLLKAKYDEKTYSFLKDFSAGFSSEGPMRLFHINGITPEAKKYKKALINENSQTVLIDDQELERVKENFDLPWKNLDAKPNKCFIGQPDLSLYQLVNWTNEIGWELKQTKRSKLKIKTIFLTNREVLEQFKKLPEYDELKSYGGKIKTMSPFNNLMAKKKLRSRIITNSNQIRINGNVKFCKEEDILDIITGKKRRK